MAKHLAAVDPHSQYAPKDSPTLTGTPKAPTVPAGNNSTQIANTAFVQAAILALIGGAPATLDTLKEMAAAINNDPNFSTTINNALALKAPLASPVLTGTPTAPTAVQSTNNTQIATTAFVKAALAGLVGSSPAALDTLNELAAALGNDPNFATTVMNALARKQPLDATLTNLSGKSVLALQQYLGLVDTISKAAAAVPSARKVNGHALSADINITSDNVNGITRDGCHMAGFVSGAAANPYMRHTSSNQVITLATNTWVTNGFQPKGNYTPAGQAYTKAESDGRYQPKGNFTPSGQAYTKAESDARYVQNIRVSATVVREFWDGRGYSSNDAAFATAISMVGGSSNVGSLLVRYVQKLINNKWVNITA